MEYVVGIVLIVWVWWWYAKKAARKRLAATVAIRAGVRKAFDRWDSPDNDQIVQTIYEESNPDHLTLAEFDAMVRPHLRDVIAELREDGTIRSRRPKRKKKSKPKALNQPSASPERIEDLKLELVRAAATFAAASTYQALLDDPEVSDAQLGELAFDALQEKLDSDSPSAKDLRDNLTRATAQSWASGVARFLRRHAATAAAVSRDQDLPSSLEHVAAFAVSQALKERDKIPWRLDEDVSILILTHLVKHYDQELEEAEDLPQQWWADFETGYEARYS